MKKKVMRGASPFLYTRLERAPSAMKGILSIVTNTACQVGVFPLVTVPVMAVFGFTGRGREAWLTGALDLTVFGVINPLLGIASR